MVCALILGGSGFLGQHIIKALEKEGSHRLGYTYLSHDIKQGVFVGPEGAGVCRGVHLGLSEACCSDLTSPITPLPIIGTFKNARGFKVDLSCGDGIDDVFQVRRMARVCVARCDERGRGMRFCAHADITPPSPPS
jgi:hypothetical protein